MIKHILMTGLAAAACVSQAHADADDVMEKASKEIVAAAARGECHLQQLISRGYNVNMTDEDGETPLMRAASRGDLNAVNALIKAGANINAADKDGTTALMEAADDGHEAVVSRLIEAGANINARDEDGETALDKATEDRQYGTAELLRKAGAK